MVGADLGNFVLELVEDLDLEGPRVGGKSGLGVQRCLGSPHSWVLHVSLLGNVVLEEADGWCQSRRLVLEFVVGLDLEGPNVGGKQPSQLGSSWQSPPQRRSW